MAEGASAQAQPKQWWEGIVGHVFAFVVCVLLPAFVTFAAPLSYVTLRYDGETVTASSTRFLYLLIPFQRETLGAVGEVDYTLRQGGVEWQRDVSRGRHRVRVAGEAALILGGRDGALAVPIGPGSVKAVAERVKAFVASPSRDGIWFVATPNWMVTFLGGVPLSLLALLYVAGCALGVARWAWGLAAGGARRRAART